MLARKSTVAAMLPEVGFVAPDGNGSGTFTGGAAAKLANSVRAFQWPLTGFGLGASYVDPVSYAIHAPKVATAILGTYAAARTLDAMTGARSPAQRFVRRFGGQTTTAASSAAEALMLHETA